MERKVLVIVPTYNEADNIRSLIEKTMSLETKVDALVVDDNSRDGTASIVEGMMKGNKRLHLLKRPGKMGLGSAYMAGFRYGIEQGFDYVITMDADFSHPPEKIPELVEKMDSVDVCVGSRYVKGSVIRNWGFIRKLISRSANLLAQIVLNSKVHDNTTGFRCYKSSVIRDILNSKIKSNGYSFLVEIAFLLQRKGYRIAEIPLYFVDRRFGNSKISKKEMIQSAKMLFRLGAIRLLRR
jgi:dolichol-phosphate mannosyltransferase